MIKTKSEKSLLVQDTAMGVEVEPDLEAQSSL